MSDDAPKPEQPAIDEAFMREWLNYGFAEMHVYLTKQAEFTKYLDRHPQTEEHDESAPQG